jgi:hypothetical protein
MISRGFEAMSDGHIEQLSLHGDSNLHSILVTGSGMYSSSGGLKLESRREQLESEYDFGACTVQQLSLL